jgi:CHAD domain-containing protein/CYTH domain-containing protein
MDAASLFQQPTARAVRVVALSLLGDAHVAAVRLRDATRAVDAADDHDDALHDFRVAVRRLRSWLLAWKPWLADSLSPKIVGRLRKTARATGPARDMTVHLAWLEEQRTALRGRNRVGVRYLIEMLASHRDDALSEAVDAAREFEARHDKLSKQLNRYCLTVEPAMARDDESFAAAFADRVKQHVETLRRRLASVHAFADQAEAHRARIAAKKLRYLIEPMSRDDDGSAALIDRLKELQSVLGDLHDVHVFAEEIAQAAEKAGAAQARRMAEAALEEDGAESVRRARAADPGPGLLAVAKHLHERGARAFARVERDWLGDASAPFLERVLTYAHDLARGARTGREIERKYLLSRLPDLPAGASSVEIEQGYLPGEHLCERVRHIRTDDGEERWFRTVKLGNGVSRLEVEDEGHAELCKAMWPFTKGQRLRKRRHSASEGGEHVWEIDEFLDRELVLAEVELTSEHEDVEAPQWLREVLVREVTEEREFTNAELARFRTSPAASV